jgi:formylglycine-generating enzyme required for sulfatase activity
MEAEWEVAAVETEAPLTDGFMPVAIDDKTRFHPAPASREDGLQQMFGGIWEWTSCPYVAYPRFRPAAGAIGEYNGKFMSNQMVLRGGAVVTPLGHIRPTYRNFFPPNARWVFGGIRLAEDA